MVANSETRNRIAARFAFSTSSCPKSVWASSKCQYVLRGAPAEGFTNANFRQAVQTVLPAHLDRWKIEHRQPSCSVGGSSVYILADSNDTNSQNRPEDPLQLRNRPGSAASSLRRTAPAFRVSGQSEPTDRLRSPSLAGPLSRAYDATPGRRSRPRESARPWPRDRRRPKSSSPPCSGG